MQLGLTFCYARLSCIFQADPKDVKMLARTTPPIQGGERSRAPCFIKCHACRVYLVLFDAELFYSIHQTSELFISGFDLLMLWELFEVFFNSVKSLFGWEGQSEQLGITGNSRWLSLESVWKNTYITNQCCGQQQRNKMNRAVSPRVLIDLWEIHTEVRRRLN